MKYKQNLHISNFLNWCFVEQGTQKRAVLELAAFLDIIKRLKRTIRGG